MAGVRAVTENLGDRIRAKRQQHWDAASGAAKDHAEKLHTTLRGYVDDQIDKAKAQVKAYVDKRIAKLAADNNLTNNP